VTAAARPPAALSPPGRRAGGRAERQRHIPQQTRNLTPNQPTKADLKNHLTTTKKLSNQTGPPQCATAGFACSAVSNLASTEQIYSFHPKADQLVSIGFPAIEVRIPVSAAYVERMNTCPPRSLEEVFLQYDKSRRTALTNELFRIDRDSIESYWLSMRKNDDKLKQFVRVLPSIQSMCAQLLSANWRFSSPLEKAVFQRDVNQIYFITISCTNFFQATTDPTILQLRNDTAAILRDVLQRLLLSEREYDDLTNAVARAVRCSRYKEQDAFDLTNDFLPLRTALNQGGWHEMKFSDAANEHFQHFKGRSFVRVFIKTPGWSQKQFFSYWDDIVDQFGDTAHLSSHTPRLPRETQTMLLRTFSVILDDGTVTDSGIPEEVLIRCFKCQDRCLDLASSDKRGTYLYQYKLSRQRLLSEPASLGLRRRAETDPSFIGFNSEVPDPHHCLTDGLVTTRYNCINCHSPILYGSSTVFSLEKSRLKNPDADPFAGTIFEATSKPGRYRFTAKEYRFLRDFVSRSETRNLE
jgi:hypothetical protein